MSSSLAGSEPLSNPSGADLSSRPTCMIVEDQVLIGLSLEAYLEDVGLNVCEPLSSAAEALEWLASNTPTVAVLDYTLKDGPCTALTGVLAERGIPFVIYSGHSRSVAPPELQPVPWIDKPCEREVLLAALTGVSPKLAEWQSSRVVV